MPNRTAKPSTTWPCLFAHRRVDLADGRVDLEDLIEKGDRLRRNHQNAP